ncbi:THUMP-like domain-containing protein [Zeaxanthinibacter enoshimensis]|uniref:Tellurite resistance protein TehB n=1 Tax=Zeaxanthinibacter enoshimensis TaxID=392009 RepID=A0A4R6TP45_9FLAO|nr:RsmD family RNA methyltransferase [Zeaxanthinibacter enoshimensis]TDQ31131.1 tellurite resistance protein TehB [Zeaxanthinibacter enoshimensis]
MNLAVLNTRVQDFINTHLDEDPTKIALNPPEIPGVEGREIAEQLASKQKCRHKLPRWYHTEGIYYPKKINIEQTSSEQTAAYKASIVKAGKVLDMTGGFGVDSFYLARDADKLDYCERNLELCSIATHNFKQLEARNITTHCKDGLGYLKENREHYDLIYIDPSRRSEVKGKVFLLTDCEPNVPKNLQTILERTATLLVKTSPLLDIKTGMDELDAVASIHIVALDNEVKELLWEIRPGYQGTTGIHCINLKGDTIEEWKFRLGKEAEASPDYGQPRKYLYEPNAAIMKSGAFKLVATDFKLLKLHEHSHLYTSDELILFPGRRFLVNSVIPYSRKNLKATGITKANITTRNFPESVQQIRKKTKIKDGGDCYLFFTKDPDNKLLVVNCSKI